MAIGGILPSLVALHSEDLYRLFDLRPGASPVRHLPYYGRAAARLARSHTWALVTGVPHGQMDLRRAYHRKSLLLHPDKNPPHRRDWAQAKFTEMANAYAPWISRSATAHCGTHRRILRSYEILLSRELRFRHQQHYGGAESQVGTLAATHADCRRRLGNGLTIFADSMASRLAAGWVVSDIHTSAAPARQRWR